MSDEVIEVYTDGSRIGQGKGCGWAYSINYHGKSVYDSIGDKGKTNNQMEMIAVLNAFRKIRRKDIPVILYSDSAYVVNTLNWKYCIRSNEKLWDELIDEMLKFKDVKIVLVKAHEKNEKNNEVDNLAYEAAREQLAECV